LVTLETAYLWLACGIFSAWLVLSVMFQFDLSWFPSVSRHDVFGVLPRWTFFAPNPGTSDYHLLYRDRLPGGPLTEWTEIPITAERRLVACLWNPEKREKKVLSDVATMLVRSAQLLPANNHSLLAVTLPYLILLNVVVHHRVAEPGARRQFVIAESTGFLPDAGPKLLMKSGFHALG
jgi:hypothetical protein